MSIPIRFPFAYKADIATDRGVFDGRILVDVVEADIPSMTASECPVAMTWRTYGEFHRPGEKSAGEGKPMIVRHREGRYYIPLQSLEEGKYHKAEDLPGRGRHDYGAEGNKGLANLYDRLAPGGEEKNRALREWFAGKFRRQPVEDDILRRSKSDREARKAEALDVVSRLAIVDGIVHIQVSEPKLAVDTCYFNHRRDMPHGVSSCPLVAVFVGEGRFGARLPHLGSRTLDAKPETLVVAIDELDDLLAEYETAGVPVLMNFDSLEFDPSLPISVDRDINRRWRAIGEVVQRFAGDVMALSDAQLQAWCRLRRVSSMREHEVTREDLDTVYDDLVGLCASIDYKDRDRARLLEMTEWWNDAPISIGLEAGGNRARI
ncbi:hypothetical protein OIU34_20365 [Pararhizobium sp. BT-229]|uniref:hypothetical protein n=1 Tax=Pararhizobium sp. BT-229 TaxID=2986923 RepID=UPI0021F6FD71|nr:hypothetical protein [Pararhizobium sp. BT-229]MCV9964243.1 hypothetical protein [Pararhizobium sp. BT-229]